MTDDELNAMTPEQREAWQATLNADERVIFFSPPGYRYTLVLIAEVKWWLVREIPAEYRLKFLQFLDKQTDTFTTEAIAAVEPMPDDGIEIIREARKLGRKWLDVVARWGVFNAFVAMNPSLLLALKMPTPHGYQPVAVSRALGRPVGR